jgi:phage-related protein
VRTTVDKVYKILYTVAVKGVEFVGSSDDDLRAFPQVARQRAGYQLHRVQSGQDPSDWKPMTTIGAGCREIRVRDSRDAYRVFYVATVGDTVYVLHCFQKKSQRTPQADIDLGKQRYKQMNELIRAKEKP